MSERLPPLSSGNPDDILWYLHDEHQMVVLALNNSAT